MDSVSHISTSHSTPGEIIKLADRFHTYKDEYKSTAYNETQARTEFINPLFELLGWDVDNKQGYSAIHKDVIHEYSLKIGDNIKAPDYAFRIGGTVKFFLEAKKPAINIREGISPAYQLRRYAWSAKLPISVLTDFEEFSIYDSRFKPGIEDKASVAREFYCTYKDYEESWGTIADILSRDAVLNGSLDDRSNKKGSATEVDEAFLKEIETWRQKLAYNITSRNPGLSVRELNAAVQKTIDRLIFLRIAEDRGIDPYGQMQDIAKDSHVYQKLLNLFYEADNRYNSGLFHFHSTDETDDPADSFTPGLSIDDDTLKSIISNLYYPESPYEFSVLPSDILGQVYERFLGKTIQLEGNSVTITEKPEVRKAGGVFYTPTYIVEHIVEKTVGAQLVNARHSDIAGRNKRRDLRIIDPACGSGSFLIEAFDHLLNWYRNQYIMDDPNKHATGRDPRLVQVSKNEWRLTVTERRRILLDHIYGVDIDPQAVEVTKLSLLLKVLEGETADAITKQIEFFRNRALPNLVTNIKCGNSLIASDFYSKYQLSQFSEDDRFRINIFNWEDEFTFLKQSKGFDVVIGNPPWVSLTGKYRNEIYTERERDFLIRRYNGNTYMPNMYEYFIYKGLELVAKNGLFSFIVPDRFAYNDQFIPLRKKVIDDFNLDEIQYGAPFPGITADTAIFVISSQPSKSDDETSIGNFGETQTNISKARIKDDHRTRFIYEGVNLSQAIVDRIRSMDGITNLSDITRTTSGVGAKTSSVSAERISANQIEILKGRCIGKYEIKQPMFFEFHRDNITGRTTDRAKLSYSPKILIRKTGTDIVAAYDESGVFPEQSLYFTFGECSVPVFYLLGLLNSKLMQFIYYTTALTNRKSIAQVKKVDLDSLPIRSDGADIEKNINAVSDAAKQITEIRGMLPNEKTREGKQIKSRLLRHAEQTIDNEIFTIYEMTDKEREYVEVEMWRQ